jgi:16S rRNA (guanine(966)-N(2))-methyltransferase RsmD
VRIVSGRFKGRRLKAPGGHATRPTSERVREALFDILGPRVTGAVFLDLYAGTGAVGVEALSRGAERVVFVESKHGAVRNLRENLEALGDPGEARVLAVPVARALRILSEEGAAADLAFCDPPYHDEEWPLLLARFGDLLPLSAGGLLLVEHAFRSPPPEPGGFEFVKAYKYGDTGLTVFEKK